MVVQQGCIPADDIFYYDRIILSDNFSGGILSPTILRIGPYRFFFYSGDKNKPAHIHVESQGNVAKFWLEPVRLQNSGGFSRKEIQELNTLVEDHRDEFRRFWYEYFHD